MTKVARRSVRALSIGIALAFLSCATADAGTYVINTCNVPGRATSSITPWYWEAGANLTPVDACARGGGFVFYFPGPLSMPRGAASALTLALPANTPISIRRVRLWVVARLAGAGSAFFVGTNSGAPDGQITNSDLFGPPGGDTLTTPHETALLPLGTNVFRVLLYCSQSSPDDCFPSSRSALEILGAEVTLIESTAPAVSLVGGTVLNDDSHELTRSVRYTAADDQSGIAKVEVLVDNAVALKRDLVAECSYADYAACPKTRSEDLTVNTADLASGTHRVKLRVTDAAGNTADSATQVMTVNKRASSGAPAAAGGSLTASFAGTARRTKTVGYRARTKVQGRLQNASGEAVARAPIGLVETVAGQPERVTDAVATTGADGSFVFRLRRGPSRRLRVRYQSPGENRPLTSSALRLKVRAATTLAVVLRGVRVRFKGRLASRNIPKAGVIVLMQGRRRGGAWQSFATRRVRRAGTFSGTYRLRVRRPGVSLQFRAVVMKARGYPYESGISRIVTRTVR